MKTLILIICFLLSGINLISQEKIISAGPAPQGDNSGITSETQTDMIGTRAFVQHSSSPTFQFGKSFMESCTVTNVGAPFTMSFPGGLMYRNGIVYTWNQNSPYQLYSIDTVTGVHTLVFNMTGIPFANLTGLTWDGTTVYGVATNLTQSQLVTANMTTGVFTPVGTPSTVCAGAISISGRRDYRNGLFAIDIVSDNLFKVNKITGAFTLIGPLGVDANFGQDAQFDNNDGALYWIAYTTGPQLRKIDTSSGSGSTLLCSYTSQGTGIALRDIIYTPPIGPQITACRTVNIPINDHSTILDSIYGVLGDDCIVNDVNVRIDEVYHTWDSDLSFYLQRGNIGAKIINKVGGSGDNFIGTILNDSVANTIESGTVPFTGTYKPSNPLTVFNGNPGITGRTWKLLITDTATGDTGSLVKWCIVITYQCPVGGIQTIEIPNYYFLNQNYPNPFNPVTNIKFGIPESGNVRLVVYDILGREVTTLMNEHKNPGTYEVKFDASQFASGIYFYSLYTIRGVETKRMLIVK
ncbi:MAG: T9SS type A sorting domain-containing protein [Ignavibacteria bacterium]|nr:T9SS type A sorting domain-containing protein [Ignavibacteria bacterium]